MSSEKENKSAQEDMPKDSNPAAESKPAQATEKKEALSKKEPLANKEPSADKEPSANQKPGEKKQQSTSQATSANEPPVLTSEVKKPDSKKADSKKSDIKPPASNTPKAAKKSGGGIFKFLFFLLLLILIGAGGYGGYWIYEHRSFFEQDLNADLKQELNTELEQQRELIAGIQRGLERERESRIGLSSQYDDQIAAINNGLVSQQNRLTELGGTSRRDWLLAEAEFLLRLANERLVIERDPANALAMLKSADKILLDLDDPDLLSLRKAVAQDITALQMVRQVDTQGVYLRLAAITEQVAHLPVSTLQLSAWEEQEAQSIPQEDLVWYRKLWQNFKSAVTNLRGLVRIQQHDQPVKALLSPEQESVIRATLLLVLEQSQVAILRGDSEVYRVSLDKAGQLLNDYFKMTNGAEGLAGQLEQLRQQSLIEVYPDISGSLRAIKDYIDMYHSRYPVQQELEQ